MNLLFSFLPPLGLTTYFSTNENIGYHGVMVPVILILVYDFFAIIIILILRLIATYILSKFILKYSTDNSSCDLSFGLNLEGNKKLLFLSLIVMSLPIYTIAISFFNVNLSTTDFSVLMLCVEFLRLSMFFVINNKFSDKTKLIRNLTIFSGAICVIIGLLHIVTGIYAVREIMDIFSVPLLFIIQILMNPSYLGNQINDILFLFLTISSLFFLVIGSIQIAWAAAIRKRTRRELYYIEFTGLVIMTIVWLAIRIILPNLYNGFAEFHTLGQLITLILNISIILITFHLLVQL